jgi:hypothetical protein
MHEIEKRTPTPIGLLRTALQAGDRRVAAPSARERAAQQTAPDTRKQHFPADHDGLPNQLQRQKRPLSPRDGQTDVARTDANGQRRIRSDQHAGSNAESDAAAVG